MNKTYGNQTIDALLESWSKEKNRESYKKIVDEIVKGSSYFYIPTNVNFENDDVYNIESSSDLKFQFTSIINSSGLLSAVVFTDPISLKFWKKDSPNLIKYSSCDFLKFCDAKHIARIIINPSTSKSFILEKGTNQQNDNKPKGNFQLESLRFWAIKKKLSNDTINEVIMSAASISTVAEMYHFGVTKKYKNIAKQADNFIFALKLDVYNEDSKKAAIIAVNKALDGKEIGLPAEVLFLEDEELFTAAKKIKDGLIYKRV